MQNTFALKYRPRNFADLVGQKAVSESLTFVLNSGKIGNAYLFSGLRGSGKTTSARIFAKALICENGISANPCEECDNCRQANEGRHIDIIEMDAASNRKIDDIRELIELTKYAPASAKFKIFILDEAHMLTKEASNALLKTLEEPPSYVKFILATTDPLKLLPTILSRTQHFRFGAIARADIAARLAFILRNEGVEFEPRALDIIARTGRGSLRDAITLLEQAVGYSKRNVTESAVVEMLNLADPKIIEEFFAVVVDGDIPAFVARLQSFEAEMLLGEVIERLKEKLVAGGDGFALMTIQRFFSILSAGKRLLESGADGEFVLYLTLFNMREAMSVLSVSEEIEAAQSLAANSNLAGSEAGGGFGGGAAGGFAGGGFGGSAGGGFAGGAGQNARAQNPQNFAQNSAQNPQNSRDVHFSQNRQNLAQTAPNAPRVQRDFTAPARTASFADGENFAANVGGNFAPNSTPNAQNLAPNAAQNFAQTPAPNSNLDHNAKNIYKKFVDKIYDRSTELGECFDAHLRFVAFECGELVLEYAKTDAASEMLRRHGRFINETLRAFFGDAARFKPVSAVPKKSLMQQVLGDDLAAKIAGNSAPSNAPQNFVPNSAGNFPRSAPSNSNLAQNPAQNLPQTPPQPAPSNPPQRNNFENFATLVSQNKQPPAAPQNPAQNPPQPAPSNAQQNFAPAAPQNPAPVAPNSNLTNAATNPPHPAQNSAQAGQNLEQGDFDFDYKLDESVPNVESFYVPSLPERESLAAQNSSQNFAQNPAQPAPQTPPQIDEVPWDLPQNEVQNAPQISAQTPPNSNLAQNPAQLAPQTSSFAVDFGALATPLTPSQETLNELKKHFGEPLVEPN